MIDMGAIEFGSYLRRKRRSLDVKQAELALRLGKSQAAISDIERGDRSDISREEVEEVLRALVAGQEDTERHLREIMNEGMREAGFLYQYKGSAPEMTSEPFDDDTLEVAHFYSGIADPRLRERVKRIMKSAVEIFDEEPEDAGPSGNRTD